MTPGADQSAEGKQQPQAIDVHVPYRDGEIGVACDSALLGIWGLPAAVARYKVGRATAENVARAFVRARVRRPDDFVIADDELPALVRLAAAQSRHPLPGDSFRSLAQALVREQALREKKFNRNVKTTLQTMATAGEAVNRRAEPVFNWLESMLLFLDAHPALNAVLLEGAGAERTTGLREPVPSLREHERRVKENLERAERKSRSGGERASQPRGRGPKQVRGSLQQQLMGPADSLRALGLIIGRLQASSVEVPASIERVSQASEPSEEEVRIAADDTVQMAHTIATEDSAELLESANRGFFYAASPVEAWSLEDFAERVADLVAGRTPSRGTAGLDSVAIALFFYLLTLFGPTPLNAPQPEPPPTAPPIVRSAPNPAPIVAVEVDITINQGDAAPTQKQLGPPKRPKDSRKPEGRQERR